MNKPDTLLTYGATDTGKTAQLGEIALWEYRRTGMISRLISADSGWDPLESPDGNLIISPTNPEGIIEAWNVEGLNDPWRALQLASEGWWPKVSAQSGLVLSKPQTADHQGRLRIQSSGKFVGQYLIEGLSTIGNVGMQDHIAHNRKMWGKNDDVPFQSVAAIDKGGKVEQETVTLGRAAGGYYGHIQDFLLLDLVPRFGRLWLVDRVVWTAHEAKGEDEINLRNVLGPATVGKAAVDRTSQKFGHSLHYTSEINFVKGTDGKMQAVREFKAWFVSHPDAVLTNMNWPAKVSVSVPKAIELLKKFPGGFIPMDAAKGGINQLLDFLYSEQKKEAQNATS